MFETRIPSTRKHTFCGISVLFSQSEFERVAPPLWRFEYGSIYNAACQMVLRTTAFWMDRHQTYLPVAYAFESGHRFWDEANDVLSGIVKHPQLKHLYRYHSHTAIGKLNAYGLQAADMLAWIMARLKVGAPENHTMRAFKPHMHRLAEGQSDRYQLFHPEGDLLRRFFAEQMAGKDHLIVDLQKAKKALLR